MGCRERGMALVTVIFLLALLLVLALVLCEKVLQATRRTASSGTRAQALHGAAAGIEWARARLAEDYRQPGGWSACLAACGRDGQYPSAPLYRLEINRAAAEIYVRDNPDGDDNPRQDNDGRLFVLARVPLGDGGEVVVESLCGAATAAQDPPGAEGDGPTDMNTAPAVSPAVPASGPLPLFSWRVR